MIVQLLICRSFYRHGIAVLCSDNSWLRERKYLLLLKRHVFCWIYVGFPLDVFLLLLILRGAHLHSEQLDLLVGEQLIVLKAGVHLARVEKWEHCVDFLLF